MVTVDAALSRDVLLARLEEDLLGPGAPDELVDELPTDRYLTGILYPRASTFAPEEDESLSGAGGGGSGEDDDDESAESVRLSAQTKPSTMGLSFSLSAVDGRAAIDVEIRFGTYAPRHRDEHGTLHDGMARAVRDTLWLRQQHELQLQGVEVYPGYRKLALPAGTPEGLELHYQAQPEGPRLMVTLALVHNAHSAEGRAERVTQTFFQTGFAVRGALGHEILPRAFETGRDDEEGRITALLYRNVQSYAVGHTCSSSWERRDGTLWVSTTWVPRTKVPAMNPLGAEAFAPLSEHPDHRPLSAAWLSGADPTNLEAGLRLVADCYGTWIAAQELRVADLATDLQPTAREQLATCRAVLGRIEAAIAHLGSPGAEDLRLSFQLANQAILRARQWGRGDEDLTWRPFQLAFILLALESTADGRHPDRDVMDLLWFPTGGGKTEAYLGLIAVLLFHRRLTHGGSARGYGTAVLMRYTLRALTVQQFQRAAGLVMACEQIRIESGDRRFGTERFSIGLWVGGGATPNKVSEAVQLTEASSCTHRQLTTCPCCQSRLRWSANAKRTEMAAWCNEADCFFAEHGPLPVYTIDEDIYRVRPSLVIGTVDKFAQIARNAQTAGLFGIGAQLAPPDLIIQDELHLISGPLGTLAGLYETAIDHLCSRDGARPKVIGSTATIRRARDQIRSLFDRETCQFPPAGLDHDDSGFAVVDRHSPGRLYVGITTAGRSARYTLQALSASLLQSATSEELPKIDRDSYSTLLAYFNSLRELGGALVLMQDVVQASIAAFSSRRNEPARKVGVPEELTSRKTAFEIRQLLDLLETAHKSPEVLLASNMISVGVDIQRLALMVVNSQPKTIAEYIQATSRVGRGKTPGLVVGIYQNARTRDRSHYETFSAWHDGIYRDVEATSVTPFASRAVEKAVHAALVALVRHLVPSMRTQPRLTEDGQREATRLRDVILARVARIDASEVAFVRGALDELIRQWIERQDVEEYWVDHGTKVGLMISAEQHAARRASGAAIDTAWPTPNSMRDVEPSTVFRLGFAPRTDAQRVD